jgi:cysteine-rich secretory family protein
MSRRAIRSYRIFVAVCVTILGIGACHASCSSLQAAAQQHANDMARRNSLDHAGFVRNRASAGAIAENVAMGCDTEACARRMWMQSPAHRANMMLGGCVAVASAVSANGRRYWAMEIGGDDQAVIRHGRLAAAGRRGARKTDARDGIIGRDFSIEGRNAP